MHDVRDDVFLNDFDDGGLVAQIHFLKSVFRMAGNLGEVFEMTGVSQAIEIDESLHLRPVDDVLEDIRADESGSPC